MPENTVYIGRGSRYGNPYPVDIHGRSEAIQLFKCNVLPSLDLSALKGKDLACWCALDKPCHGDEIIKAYDNLCQSV